MAYFPIDNYIPAAEHQNRQDCQRRKQNKGEQILPPGKAAAVGLKSRKLFQNQNTAL